MIISIKDSFKLFGIFIITCCAVTVCNMFLNYYFDITGIESLINNEYAQIFYDAQVMTCKVVCGVSGGCLLATTVVMLFFYIKHYIDSHGKEIGILKALGYSDFRIARSFSVFGLSVFAGCFAGYLLSFALMPSFYELQNKDSILPEISVGFHPELFIYLVVAPAIIFACIAVVHSMKKLKQPAVNLLKGIAKVKNKNVDIKSRKNFITDMKSAVLRGRKTLVFFICFSSFCYAAMAQMSASMKDLSSEYMGIMIFIIGVTLALTTLYIAVTTVINSNRKNIAMMRVFGYQASQCKKAVLDGYRPAAYIGFVIGTAYQFGLLKIMVNIVFADFEGVPDYNFDVKMFFITLATFVVVYEGIMLIYSARIKKISVKEIMGD
ncbi:MAG: ABC transporter permease [Ruminococcus sp.]|nr:ABC transporter permease [Ruminococcus sp.]